MSFATIVDEYKPREEHLDFLADLLGKGAPLDTGAVDLLLAKNVITSDIAKELVSDDKKKDEVVSALDRHVLTIEGYLAKCAADGMYARLANDKDIGKDIDGLYNIKIDHWKPEYPAEFDEDFVKFILSHAIRFCDLKAYYPFFLYVQQARQWLEQEVPDLDRMSYYDRVDYWLDEYNRVQQNTYYAIERYGWYKEDHLPNGEGKFLCNMAHIFLLFLLDTGRSAYIGKPRQIASTTLLMLAANFKTIGKRNHFTKLIACDLETTEEIFEDKFKYGMGRIPLALRPTGRGILNDRDNLYRVAFKPSSAKGERKAITSKFNIVAPKESAINGGAPAVVFVDEAPFLSIFGGMVKEAWPTWLSTDSKGRLTINRQLFAWGTGGRSAKGGGDFEKEHRALFDAWQAGNYSLGIVPVFLDWTCRPNITEEVYNEQRLKYTSNTSLDDVKQLENLIQFRQHYPSNLDDMYSVSENTLVSGSFIIQNQDKINRLPRHMRPAFGHFELVYDESKTNPVGSKLKHPVKSVIWVPAAEGVVDAPCCMFIDKKPSWKHRMYQGTDPIEKDTGTSKHASVIWDEHFKTIACAVNYRTNNSYDVYTQSIAMGMYYANHGEDFCPELIENNIAKIYFEWKQGHEWRGTKSIVSNKMLPSFLHGGNDPLGINTKQQRKKHLVDLGTNMTMEHGRNIYHPVYWTQLRHFVPKTTTSGAVTWSVDDWKTNNDDILIASWLAYVCRMAYSFRMPEDTVDSEIGLPKEKQNRTKYKYVFDRQTMRTTLVEVPLKRHGKKAKDRTAG